MAHGIDNSRGEHAMFSRKEIPWHRLGKVVDNALTSEEAIKAAQLDYTVYKERLYAKYGSNIIASNHELAKQRGTLIEGYYVTVRNDTGQPLGIVKSRYEIIQNIDAFNFIDNIVGSKQAIFETAGGLGKGERVFVTAKLPNNIKVSNVDTIEKYILFTTTHDGSGSVIAGFTPIRVVCNNTLNMALGNMSNKITIRHTKNSKNKIAEAQHIMGAYEKYSNLFSEAIGTLASKQVNESIINDTISSTILTDSEFELVKKYGTIDLEEISTRKKNEIILIKDSIDKAPGQDLHRGSAFWLFNGVSSYFSNVKTYRSDEAKFDNIIDGGANKKVQGVFNKMIELV